jgi:hypothetical protein
MPEIPVAENSNSLASKYHVWFSGQAGDMEAISNPPTPKFPPEQKLCLGVL